MNNKVKQVLVLLFVVSTLLIMIGSVSANTDNLNENLEASNTLNDDLSAVPEVDSGADKDVSNQLTISNIDEQTNGSSSLGESNSENVVSNYDDTTIDAKDSDNNIKTGNEGNNVLAANPDLVITNTALNPISGPGDLVTFEVFVKNYGGTYIGTDWVWVKFIGINFYYNHYQLEYAGCSYDNPGNYLDARINPDGNSDFLQFAYNTGIDPLDNGDSFNFNVNFRVKDNCYGIFETTAAITQMDTVKSTNRTNSKRPDLVITNTALNPISGPGDLVTFEVFVKNNGGTYIGTDWGWLKFIGINFDYNHDQLQYVSYSYDKPGNYLDAKINPDNNFNLLQFAYNTGIDPLNYGDSFKFNVTFNVKDNNYGKFDTTASITQMDYVRSTASTNSMAPNIQITNTALTPYTNIGEDVSFEVSGKNEGGTVTVNDGFIGVGFEYNKAQLEYQTLIANDNPEKYNLGQYDNPSFEIYEQYIGDPNGLVVGIATNKFCYGDTFNFTLTFKVREHGNFQTTAFFWQNRGFRSTAQVISSDTNFIISESPNALTMKVGDNLVFTYNVINKGAKYDGDYISLDIFFDADRMNYMDFTKIPSLNFESLEYISAHNAENALGIADGFLLGADSSVGHLKLGYTSEDGFNPGDSFSFDVKFNALKDGKLQSDSILGWDESKYSTMVSAHAFAGDPSFKLTKTAITQFVNIGDTADYEIFLENNGTLQYTENGMVITINDYYPGGLNFLGLDVNPDKNGFTPKIHYSVDAEHSSINIQFDLNENGMSEGWAPGSTLNITLHFGVEANGILCNWAFSEWNTKDVASVVSGDPEINLTKKCLNSTVEVGDLVYYEIYLENTGDIVYFDHSQGGSDYLIIEDIYPEGLKYIDYIPNPDKRGNSWPDNYRSVEDDNETHRVIIKYQLYNQRWDRGDSLNVTLIFQATDVGKLTNKAKFYWLWDDTITGSGNEINLTDESDVVVGPPAFSLDKISNYKEAKVGDIVSFSIVYSNTGNRTITGAYITDNTYSQGLEYYDFSDKELWTFDGKDTWYYNNKLEPGESATLQLFFKALTTGVKSNTATAGHNMNNDTMEDTDTVLIKEGVNGTADIEGSGVSPDEPEDEPDEVPDEVPDEEPDVESEIKDSVVAAKSTLHETGNPLFVLLLSLLTLCFVQRKGKK